MQSRMDRYNTVDSNDTNVRSRTQRNQSLYEKIKTSDIKSFDVNNNMSVIDDNIKSVNINKVHNFLDEKYGDNTAKRRSIDLPELGNTQEMDVIMDTKEYDINAIIEKAKQGKNIDYSKERLKKVREAQYEILNNLDSEIENLSSVDIAKEKRKKEEENLQNLINTITQIEIKNKNIKDTSSDLELFSDLMDDPVDDKKDKGMDLDTIDITEEIKKIKEEESKKLETEEIPTIELTDTTPDIVIGGVQVQEDTLNNKLLKDERTMEIATVKPSEKKVDETLSKLDIDVSSYDDFNDINRKDGASTILKIVIFIVFIILILGALYILNKLLGLGIIPF